MSHYSWWFGLVCRLLRPKKLVETLINVAKTSGLLDFDTDRHIDYRTIAQALACSATEEPRPVIYMDSII